MKRQSMQSSSFSIKCHVALTHSCRSAVPNARNSELANFPQHRQALSYVWACLFRTHLSVNIPDNIIWSGQSCDYVQARRKITSKPSNYRVSRSEEITENHKARARKVFQENLQSSRRSIGSGRVGFRKPDTPWWNMKGFYGVIINIITLLALHRILVVRTK